MSEETTPEPTTPEPTTPPAAAPAAAPATFDPDGDGVPGVSWPAAAIVIAVVVALGALLFFDKLPAEVVVLLVGGISENVRGKITQRRG